MGYMFLSQPASGAPVSGAPVPTSHRDIWELASYSANPCFKSRELFSQERNEDLQGVLVVVLLVSMSCLCLLTLVPILFCGTEEEAGRIQMISLYAIVVLAVIAEYLAARHYLQDLDEMR
jgi:hypothetical protein